MHPCRGGWQRAACACASLCSAKPVRCGFRGPAAEGASCCKVVPAPPNCLSGPAPCPVPQLFLTGEGEALLPVFANVLALSPEEVARCREGLEAKRSTDVPLAAAAAAVDGAASLMGGWGDWSSWLGGTGGSGGGAAAASAGIAVTPGRQGSRQLA